MKNVDEIIDACAKEGKIEITVFEALEIIKYQKEEIERLRNKLK
jgi:hypothetical protein